jgi:hypothetical protein
MRHMTLAMGAFVGMASLVTAGGQTRDEFSLTVKLKTRYDPKLTACTLVRTGEPFVVVFTNGERTTLISGKLERPKNQVVALQLDVEQGDRDRWILDRLVYELKPGVTAEHPVIVETCNHPGDYEREISLTRGNCPSLSDVFSP